MIHGLDVISPQIQNSGQAVAESPPENWRHREKRELVVLW